MHSIPVCIDSPIIEMWDLPALAPMQQKINYCYSHAFMIESWIMFCW